MNKAITYGFGLVYCASIESEKLFEPQDNRAKKLLALLKKYSQNSNPFV